MGFWVYMLRCADGSFYVGHTDDLERRLAEHHSGERAGYTSTRRPGVGRKSAQLARRRSNARGRSRTGAEPRNRRWAVVTLRA